MAQTGYTPILIYSSSTASQAPAAGNLTNSTLGSELAINITDGKLFYKDNANAVQVIGWKTTPTTAGGTGLTSYTAGDLLYYASGTTLSKLAIGTSGQWLGSSGTAPQWNSPAALTKTDDTNVTLTLGGSASTALLNAASLTLGWTGQLAVTRGGTGLSTVAQGDILYGSASNTLSALAKNTTASRYLSNTGTSNNPAWAQIDLTNGVTGTLPVGNGGTGTATAFTAGSVLFAGASGVYSQNNAKFFWDNTNGLLGLGTNAPGYILHVVGTSYFNATKSDSIGVNANYLGSGGYWNVRTNTNNDWCLDRYYGGSFNSLIVKNDTGNLEVTSGNIVPKTAAKGINFTANSAAAGMTSQLLNWYEEGTFTPTVYGTTTAGTVTYATQIGRYTRIGRLVTVEIYLNWNSGTGTGNLLFGGLPYAMASGNYGAVSLVPENIALTAGNIMFGRILSGATYIEPLQGPTGGGGLNTVPYDGAGNIMITATYSV